MMRPRHRLGVVRWLTALLCLLTVAACSPGPSEKRAPTGHYEGTLTYRGAELRVLFELRQDTLGTLFAELQAPALPLLARWFDAVAYRDGELQAKAGGVQVSLREEPNFLTGTVSWGDSLRAEALFVRRGNAAPAAFSAVQQPTNYPGTTPESWLLQPVRTDTLLPAVALLPDSSFVGAAYARADWLARRGFAVLLAEPTAATLPDSLAQSTAAAMLRYLRRLPHADTTRVGLWAMGHTGRGAALAAAPAWVPSFVVLQQAPFVPADRPLLRELAQRRVPVLALYSTAEAEPAVLESVQQLRAELKGRVQVRVAPNANRRLVGSRLISSQDSVRAGTGSGKAVPELETGIVRWLAETGKR